MLRGFYRTKCYIHISSETSNEISVTFSYSFSDNSAYIDIRLLPSEKAFPFLTTTCTKRISKRCIQCKDKNFEVEKKTKMQRTALYDAVVSYRVRYTSTTVLSVSQPMEYTQAPAPTTSITTSTNTTVSLTPMLASV